MHGWRKHTMQASVVYTVYNTIIIGPARIAVPGTERQRRTQRECRPRAERQRRISPIDATARSIWCYVQSAKLPLFVNVLLIQCFRCHNHSNADLLITYLILCRYILWILSSLLNNFINIWLRFILMFSDDDNWSDTVADNIIQWTRDLRPKHIIWTNLTFELSNKCRESKKTYCLLKYVS